MNGVWSVECMECGILGAAGGSVGGVCEGVHGGRL